MGSKIIMHDGNFGADWVNLVSDGELIAQVLYKADGSQKTNAERIVAGWNAVDEVMDIGDAVLEAGTAVAAGAAKRHEVIATLTDELRYLAANIAPGMTAVAVDALRMRILSAFAVAMDLAE